jgi:hypothetical protein
MGRLLIQIATPSRPANFVRASRSTAQPPSQSRGILDDRIASSHLRYRHRERQRDTIDQAVVYPLSALTGPAIDLQRSERCLTLTGAIDCATMSGMGMESPDNRREADDSYRTLMRR